MQKLQPIPVKVTIVAVLGALVTLSCDQADGHLPYLHDNLPDWSENATVKSYRYCYFRLGYDLKNRTSAVKERIMTRHVRRDLLRALSDPNDPASEGFEVFFSAITDDKKVDPKTNRSTIDDLTFDRGDRISEPDTRAIYFTGHSLGGAMATAAAAELLLPSAILNNIAEDDKALGAHSSKLKHYVYLVDPVLRKQDSSSLEKAIRTLLAKNQIEISALARQIFEKNGNLAYLPALETEDARLKAFQVFGSPRVGNAAVKRVLESYAAKTGMAILRFENVWLKEDDEFGGDTVTRVPLSDVANWSYRHVGIRVFYDQQSDGGSYRGPELLKCQYTDEAADRAGRLSLKNKDIALTSGNHHMMGLYKDRLVKLLSETKAWESGDVGLSEEHSCRDLTKLMTYTFD